MEHSTPHPSVASVCDALGRKAMADRLNVGLTAISNACVENKFSARWFMIVNQMCQDAGVSCPEHLFTFIGADHADAQKGAA